MFFVCVVASIGLAGVVAIAAWQISQEGSKPDSMTLILLALAVFLFAALFFPRTVVAAVNRINNLDILGVKIELQVEKARSVVDRLPTSDDEVQVPPRPQAPTVRGEVALVAAEQKRKLRFFRDAVLNDDPSLEESFVAAHVEYLQLFEENEAEICRRILSPDLGHDLSRWDGSDRTAFLDDAWSFAWRFATRMFDRYVRRELGEAGWFVADFEQSRKHRADFLVRKNGHWGLVAARVAAPRKTAENTAERLSTAVCPVDVRRLVIVPDYVDHLWSELKTGPKELAAGTVLAVRLQQLIDEPSILTWQDAVRA